MKIIKKFFIKLSIIFIISIMILFLLILSAQEGYLDKPIKKLFELYLNKQGITAIIGDLKVKDNKLSINTISIDLADNTKGKINNLQINFHIKNIVTNPIILSKLNIDNFSIFSKNNQQIFDSVVSVDYVIGFLKNKITANINLDSLKTIISSNNQNIYTPIGKFSCLYKTQIFANQNKFINCKLLLDNQSSLSFNSIIKDDKIRVNGNITNISIMIYKIIEKIIPNNKTILFLQQYIKSGYIKDGEFSFNLDKNLLTTDNWLENTLKAKLHIIDLEYKYDEDFPSLNKIDTNVVILGSSIQFLLNQAYSSNTLIKNGIIDFNWQGLKKSYFTVNAYANGPVADLIDFIPGDIYKKTKESGIDWRKVTGLANSKIDIIIPINPNEKNTYNISTTLSDVGIKSFNNNVILQDAKITGTFNGDKISLTGYGNINSEPSTLSYQHNITENNKDDYEYLLKVKTNINTKKQFITIIKIMSGKSILDFEYKGKKDKQSVVTANIDLTNQELYFDKISIYKKINKHASLKILGKLDQYLNGNIDFNLTGEDNLKIIGTIKVKDNKYNINLPSINFQETDVASKILLDSNNVNIVIHGRTLDLSHANMLQFLEKEGDAKNIYFDVNLDKVKLKNNIWLNNLKLNINCDKVKCFSGSLDSKIGSRPFTMILTTKDNFEQWAVSCGNAGALFKAIGMYNNMKAGNINLLLNTKRYEVKKGEIIPILDGTFYLKHFVATDISFFTRIVSFVSLPGFMSFIVNNKDILFESMNGKFSYIDNVITISDTSASGPFFDFTMKGEIDTNKHKIKLKGNVIPSFFLASTIITKIPIIGKIFSKVAPYSIELEYKE